MAAKNIIEIKKGTGGEWFYRIKCAGRILCSGKGYNTKRALIKTVSNMIFRFREGRYVYRLGKK